jgi:hypothetical protein
MTTVELFAYVLLPLGIALVGGGSAYLYVWADKRRGQKQHHPAE